MIKISKIIFPLWLNWKRIPVTSLKTLMESRKRDGWMDGSFWREGCWKVVSELRRSRIISCQQKEMKEVRFYSSRSLSDRPKTEAIGSVRHAVFCHIILVRKQEQRFLQKRFSLIYFHFIDSEKQKKPQSLCINTSVVAVHMLIWNFPNQKGFFLSL